MIGPLPLLYFMPVRRHELIAAVAGLNASGVPLVGLDQGRLYPVGVSDDVGLHLLTVLVARITGLAPLAAASAVLYGLLGVSLVVGAWGWWLYARNPWSRALFLAALVPLAWMALHFGDVYLALTATPIACVPPLLALWRRGGEPRRWRWALVATGVGAGVGTLLRADAGAIVCVFAAVLVLGRTREALRQRVLQTTLLALGVLVPVLALRGAQLHRDRYLAQRLPGYEPPPSAHIVWHAIYIGFGLLANDRGLEYKDQVAGRVVARLAPDAAPASPRYIAVLRQQVFRLVVEDPTFVARTVFAKLGILSMYVLVFANVGLVAAVRARKPVALELAFAAAIGVAALPGVLAFPALYYLEGFATLAALYGLVSVDWALGERRRAR